MGERGWCRSLTSGGPEIGGTTLGDFDRIEHTLGSGFPTLGGTLDVSLINSFEPELGDSFGFLLAAGGYAGTFDTLKR